MYNEIERNQRMTWIIVIVFILFLMFLGYFYGLVTDVGYYGIVIGLIVAVPTTLIGYYNADKMVLYMAGARPVAKKDNALLYNLVENLAIASGMPTPKVYVIEDTAMNAFATGRDPAHAAVAVTTGLLQVLSKKELEGVLAHEMSHVKNFDTRLSTVVVIFVGMVAIAADLFWRMGGGRKRGSRQGVGILAIIGLVFILLSPLVAKLLQMAMSRNREYLADSDGALLTRYPEGLALALEKISSQDHLVDGTNNAMNHLFIINPLESLDGKKIGSWLGNLFSTHPPTAERIKRLREMII
ncbi:MAG: M48 family metallopeptidase [Patescibacteria group bacterium]